MSIPRYGDPAHFPTDFTVTPTGAAGISCNCKEGAVGPTLGIATNVMFQHCQSGNQHTLRREREA